MLPNKFMYAVIFSPGFFFIMSGQCAQAKKTHTVQEWLVSVFLNMTDFSILGLACSSD